MPLFTPSTHSLTNSYIWPFGDTRPLETFWTLADHRNVECIEKVSLEFVRVSRTNMVQPGTTPSMDVCALLHLNHNFLRLTNLRNFVMVKAQLFYSIGCLTAKEDGSWCDEYRQFVDHSLARANEGLMDLREFTAECSEVVFKKLLDLGDEKTRIFSECIPSLFWPLLLRQCSETGPCPYREVSCRFLERRRASEPLCTQGGPRGLGDLSALPLVALVEVVRHLPRGSLRLVASVSKGMRSLVHTAIQPKRNPERWPDVVEQWSYCQCAVGTAMWHHRATTRYERLNVLRLWGRHFDIGKHMERLEQHKLELELRQLYFDHKVEPPHKTRKLPTSILQHKSEEKPAFPMSAVEQLDGVQFRTLINRILERTDRSMRENLDDMLQLITMRGERKAGGAFLTDRCFDQKDLPILQFFIERVNNPAYSTIYNSYLESAVSCDNHITLHYLLLRGGIMDSLYDRCIKASAIKCIELLDKGGLPMQTLLHYHTALTSRKPEVTRVRQRLEESIVQNNITVESCIGPLPEITH